MVAVWIKPGRITKAVTSCRYNSLAWGIVTLCPVNTDSRCRCGVFTSLLLCLWLLVPHLSLAESVTVPEPEQEPVPDSIVECDDALEDCAAAVELFPTPKLPEEQSFFSFLDAPQLAMSRGLTDLTTVLDEFFADERVFYDKTGSYMRLTTDIIMSDMEDTQYSGDLKVKVRLPRTQEKLKLTLESNPEEQRDALDRTRDDTLRGVAEEKSYYAGIEATLGREDKWRIKPSIGLKFSSPIDIFFRWRADRDYRHERWLFRPSQTFITFKEKGFISDSQLDIDYQATENVVLRSSSFIRYTDENDYYEPSQVFSILHKLSERRAISYQVGVYGISEDTSTYATDYLALVRYRQNIHKDYLFLELIPEIRYQRENDFQPEHYFTLRLELVFEG